MLQIQLLTLLLTARLARRDERGVSAVEWVIITALLIGIAGAVGFAISNAIESEANNIDLGL